jgi:phosphatase NudJ
MEVRWKPNVTVAAVVEHAGRYLLVEENTRDGLLLNNPAGHLDLGESPLEGVKREALEETAREFTPEGFLGVYLSRFRKTYSEEDITYLRLAFAGQVGEPIPGQTLDDGIVRTVWMSIEEIEHAADEGRLRSPLVLQCVRDHRAGRLFPLDAVYADASLYGAP